MPTLARRPTAPRLSEGVPSEATTLAPIPPPESRLFLIAGFHGRRLSNWTILARHGGPTLSLRKAWFFAHDMGGMIAAQNAANVFRHRFGPRGTAFTARVIVTGPPEDPVDVVEAWRLERPEPVDIRHYSFEP